MTAVNWLIEQLTYKSKEKFFNSWQEDADLTEFVEQAKQMEKQQIIDAWKDGYGGNAHDENEYFAETYGSKGSDERIVDTNKTIISQAEISDEEIEKAAKQTFREHPNNPKEHTDWTYGKDVNFARKQKAFIKGAKWYREQLKKK